MNDRVGSSLLDPLRLGALELPNRVIMAPMTRLRSDDGLAPTELVAEYYAQRAGAGLIIGEAMAVRPYGAGFPALAAIYTPEQQAGWARVVRRVHEAGGRIAAQLWDVGLARAERPGQPWGWAVADEVRPAMLARDDIAALTAGFERAARAAQDAGFDMIEMHASSGNLFDRFLRPATNARTDEYGGALAGRLRLLHELLDRLQAVMGAARVGLKLSPSAMVDGGPDPSARDNFAAILRELSARELAYVHVTRTTADDRARGSGPGLSFAELRSHYRGTLLGAGDLGQAEAEVLLTERQIDGAVFGRLFIANPDLPARFAARAALNPPDRATFYTPGAAGFTDYPRLPG
ncbi:alkene reductase [Nannocystis sp. SCPEA4]|uniref:oxidoreductase n=1 Tax=Nannocystis sp. SCPEA4 TaxID=2996787 RepID=UPI00226F092C|nr:alkene reductase [Nannocystis sp. SCPEA4]MCY1054427.1 alkene reductase [Nannocystis sp. SCPEA4]